MGITLEHLEERRLLTLSDPLVNVAGMTSGSRPPDTVMDVGTNHVIQMVNATSFEIFDKHGTSLAGPTAFGSLWANNTQVTPDPDNRCQSEGRGDPIVVFDHLADRWLTSQFFRNNARTEFGMCIAISQTADPVKGADGVAGNGDEWLLYRFDTAEFPDYPKFGVWPDGYYMTSNESNLGIYVFERAKMLAGDPTAAMVRTDIPELGGGGIRSTRILPADLDGPAPPPGTPNYFARTVDDQQDAGDARDRIEIYAAVPDYAGGTLAFNLVEDIDVGDGLDAFDIMTCDRNGLPPVVNPGDPNPVRDCIPQPDTEDTVDALSNRPMMQLKYRNFGDYQVMVFNQTIDMENFVDDQTDYNPTDEVAGIRWYEVRTTDGGNNWSIEQQGDYAPQPPDLAAEDEILHRWMGSAAMDKDGNIAVGYSITNSDDDNEVYPGIRYAGRRYDDAAGQLPQGELVIRDGTTFQGNNDGNVQPQRWGDYSAISVDPVDDCTFWYSTHVANGGTQIASFRFDTCTPADDYEPNDTIADAAILGSLPAITLRDMTIDGESDVDFYKYTAHDTGMLVINALAASEYDLVFQVVDRGADLIKASGAPTEILPGLSVRGVAIPVVAQQEYFIEVSATNNQFFEYDLEIENFAAPIPDAPWLDPADDTGKSNSDNVTAEEEARVFIEADLHQFALIGIPILSSTDAEAGDAGAAVEVVVNGQPVGFADLMPGTNHTLFQYTFEPGELSTTFIPTIGGGGLNVVKGAVRIIDGQDPPQDGRSKESSPLLLTLDMTAPDPSVPVLVESSDSGTVGDGVTNETSPAFTGVAEENALVRLYATEAGQTPDLATAAPIGEGFATGIHESQQLGTWEITSEPLADGEYDIFVIVIDAAGNASEVSEETPIETIVVDSLAPQRPTMDLIDPFDTGMSATDNNTRLTTLDFRVTGDPGESVTVKDGNFPVVTFLMPATGETIVTLDFVLLEVTTGYPAEGPHPMSAEATDLAGNRSAQSEELLVTIDLTAPLTTVPALLATSDTGTWDNDRVTGQSSPAFNGTVSFELPDDVVAAEAGVTLFLGTVDLNGNEVIIGEADLLLDNGASDQLEPVDWEITSEPLDDSVYVFFAIVQDLAGNVYRTENSDPVEIDTLAPNLPLLDLIEADDSGRHNDDNITNVNEPTLTMTTHDPNLIYHDLFEADQEYLMYRVFDRFEESDEFLLYDSAIDPAVAGADGFTNLTLLTILITDQLGGILNDGIHNLKLEVEDRAGNISDDFLLDLLVDTVAYLGDGDLHPESDSGVAGYTFTNEDDVTNDKTPEFFGVAEANNLVYVTIDGVAAGTAIAIPVDGDDGYQPSGDGTLIEGNWQVLTNLNLADGEHEAVFTFEDPAGNQVASEPLLFFVDTQGPQVTDIYIDGSAGFNLFNPKPSDGPTPLVDALAIDVIDFPPRTATFDYEALFEQVAENVGHFQLVGDHNGPIAIESVVFNSDPVVAGQPATGTLVLTFFEPLPDDRFTLTISDSIVDDAGNALDGETNAQQPVDPPVFPSGDGQPGGSLIGRFTVDSRAELGAWAAGSVYVDTNGNFVFDPEGKDGDTTNEDITYVLGFTSDNIFAGNFAARPGDTADGFDKLAAYGRLGGAWRWLIDTDNNGVPNMVITDPANVSGIPVAGNFDGDATNGDEVGIYTGNTWYFDTTHNFRVNASFASNMIGYPIVGDFDGDGIDDLGTWADDTFMLDASSTDGVIDGLVDHQFRFGFIGVRERPVAADMDGDGIDDIGLWVPDRAGATPAGFAEWYFLISGGSSMIDRIVPNPQGGGFVVDFTPVPFGNDLFAQFGDQFGLPVVGNFDPPVVPQDPPDYDFLSFQNPVTNTDVNNDTFTSPIDALLVINALNRGGSRALPLIRSEASVVETPMLDVTGDYFLSPIDALVIINLLNQGDGAEGEGEGGAAEGASSYSTLAVWNTPTLPTAAAANMEAESEIGAAQRPTLIELEMGGTIPLTVGLAAREINDFSTARLANLDERLDNLIDQFADDVDERWNFDEQGDEL